MAFWRGYWITLRPYLFFVSGASGLLGLSLVSEDRLGGPGFAAALLAFLLCYGLGQAVTDVFQIDTDALSAPYRPLVRGEIQRGPVLAVSLGGLGLCGATLFSLNPWTLPVAGTAVLGLITYTPLKRRYWGGPGWNSWIVALLPLLGLLCGGASLPAAFLHPLLLPAMSSVFCSYGIFVVIGYLKDVEADRRTGYETLPVRFGRRAAVAVSGGLLVGTVASHALLVARSGALDGRLTASMAPLAACASGLGLLGVAHLLALQVRRDEDAHRAVAMVVRGYVALHLGQATLVAPGLSALAVALYLVFEAVLRARPCEAQV